MSKTLDTSGKTFIKDHEGLRLTVYEDVAGYLTVGYGHKIVSADNLRLNDTITQTKADTFFTNDVSTAVNATNGHPKVDKLSQSQFNAVVSLCFNVGTKPVSDDKNDLYKALNDSNTYKTPISTACKNAVITGFTYTKANGVRNKGLTNRRNDELNLFLGTSGEVYITYP